MSRHLYFFSHSGIPLLMGSHHAKMQQQLEQEKQRAAASESARRDAEAEADEAHDNQVRAQILIEKFSDALETNEQLRQQSMQEAELQK